MSVLQSYLRRFGTKTTKVAALCTGERFPFYYVTEYPRSGGTWLSQMIADYLQIPFPTHYVLPIGFESVLHNHWSYSPRLKRVFYLYRDGRDICVSMLFFALRGLRLQDPATHRYFSRRLAGIGSADINELNPAQLMPRFVEAWVKRPMGCRQSWTSHVAEWAFERPNVVCVTYEDLRRDCVGR